jgi:hypothetical protein
MTTRRGFLVGMAATAVGGTFLGLPQVHAMQPTRPPEVTYCPQCQPDFLGGLWHANRSTFSYCPNVFLGGKQILHCMEVGHGWYAEGLRYTGQYDEYDDPIYKEPVSCPDCHALLYHIVHAHVTLDFGEHGQVRL